jgi:glyoxylase-like metal-dependent hydrolase (beta-lactamase superfamily II)
MDIQKIGTRGLLFTFPGFLPFPKVPMPIQIYVIKGKNNLYICDTGINTENMEHLKKCLQRNKLLSKPIILFNSHFHMDHIGGNGVFESAQIISHIVCREKMVNMIERFKKQNKKKLGGKSISFPSLIFQERIIFPEDNVEFFYSPGHSEDSSSCYDKVDQILYVGDNLVDPIPYLTWYGFDRYSASLQNYCNLKIKTIILGHKSVFDDISLIKKSINYIKNFQNFNVDISNFTPQHAAWFRWSFLDLGLDLKKHGRNNEALKYFKYIKDLIRHPQIKPLDKSELREIEDFLNRELIS